MPKFPPTGFEQAWFGTTDHRELGAPALPPVLLAPLIAAPLAMAVIDAQGTIVGWNDFATALLGWKARDVVGRSIETTVLPDELIQAYRDIAKSRPADDARIAIRRFSIPLRTSDGWEPVVEIALASSLDPNQTLYAVYAWIPDEPAGAAKRGVNARSASGRGRQRPVIDGACPQPLPASECPAPAGASARGGEAGTNVVSLFDPNA